MRALYLATLSMPDGELRQARVVSLNPWTARHTLLRRFGAGAVILSLYCARDVAQRSAA